jgi:hypothetical protein
MQLKRYLAAVPDPRGKQGQDYPLWSILSLIIVGFLCGRQGLQAVHRLGRKLNAGQRSALGFVHGRTPCHATLTETVRILDPKALRDVLHQVVVITANGNRRHVAIDGKTMKATKNAQGHAVHVVSAFCSGLGHLIGTEASHSKGMEIPDAFKLLEQLDLRDTIVTGDAMFCRKSLTEKIVAKGGDYLFPVKGNQKNLAGAIATAFNQPVFPPQAPRYRRSKSARAH